MRIFCLCFLPSSAPTRNWLLFLVQVAAAVIYTATAALGTAAQTGLRMQAYMMQRTVTIYHQHCDSSGTSSITAQP